MCSNCDVSEQVRSVTFEPANNGRVWVVEHVGASELRTGPFATEEKAREWFREVLEREI